MFFRLPKIVWVAIFVFMALPIVVWHTVSRLDTLEPQTYIADRHKHHSTVGTTIAVVGDSWAQDAYDGGFDAALRRRTGHKVVSAGVAEATTKEVYYEMAHDRLEWLIEGRPLYAIIMAGLYDHAGQYGPSYYAYHMDKIVDMLNYYGIRPVIVGIPHYPVDSLLASYGMPHRAYLRYFSIVTTGSWRLNNFHLYRDALQPDSLRGRAIYIPAEELHLEDSTSWASPLKLSRQGYDNVAAAIARRIAPRRKRK